MNIIKDYGDHFLRDDTEIRKGLECFKGVEEAYSLFQRYPEYKRVHIYAGPKEWAIKEADAILRPHVSIGGPYVTIEVYRALLEEHEKLKQEFGKIYTSMKEETKTDMALDIIFGVIDELLLDGKFDSVDKICMTFVENLHNLEEVLAVLTITLPAKSKLPNRELLLAAAKEFFKDAEASVWSGL